mmetsp:Transcript_23636/g.33014  ORF Transcript_23636/g.33014 Transcript_23636/m.33014 type:complete len:314 (-) Transcript_23636:480-1421(-)|eukprot:CAMPEP_0184486176 /NCGR_PEP_ID=MMETSP0113_2-20130426/7713_1 /TAXON_ID=91329 /ORGANISM="Norrisiella sphaerica, Strain BC52" /LENGTH=313 /DNA_ID=CAMNT_0026867931 /DNA_START=308 /DNA_END=1249 /DNA_ORIENTATION=+
MDSNEEAKSARKLSNGVPSTCSLTSPSATSNPTTLYVIRHGETDWNAQKRIQGQTDTELNSNGKRQARLLAKAIEFLPCNAIVSSDLKRAYDTAKIVRDHFLSKAQRQHFPNTTATNSSTGTTTNSSSSAVTNTSGAITNYYDNTSMSTNATSNAGKATLDMSSNAARIPDIVTDKRLRELHAGDLQGALGTDVNVSRKRNMIYGMWKQGKTHVRYPGKDGESLDALVERAYDGIRNAAELAGEGGHAFVFCHGGLIRSLARDILDKEKKKMGMSPATNCCVSTLKYFREDGRLEIVKMFEKVIVEETKDDSG